jgi:tRNA A-37 threonylcarbamoyl transferase component Bud32
MENCVHFELLGYRWTVTPECGAILKEHVIPSVLSGGGSSLRPIKRKPARELLAFVEGDCRIFVKIHTYHKRVDRLKTMLLPSRAETEWTIGRQMLARGLPVAEPLGFGVKRSGGVGTGAILFQRLIPDCVSMAEYLGRNASWSETSGELLVSLGELLRQLHAEGFWHPDLHTGNLLVDSARKLWIVDLHATGRISPVPTRRRMADLSKLVFSLDGLVGEEGLRTLLKSYSHAAGDAEVEETLSHLRAKADSLRRRRIRSRAKRCVKTSGSFVIETVNGKRIYRRREFDTRVVLEAISRHKEIRASGGTGLIKQTSKSAVTSVVLENAPEKLYVKEFSNGGLIRLVESLFLSHRGRRAWKANHRLRLLGALCAEPLALLEERRLGLPRTSYLVTKEIPNACRLNEFLVHNYFRVSERLTREQTRQKRKFIRDGARAFREFHSRNIYHKDMSPKNLLVSTENGETRFYCVDSDSIQFPRRLSLRRKIKNLAQLNGLPGCITATDRLRFCKEYFELNRFDTKHRLILSVVRLLSERRVWISRQIDKAMRDSNSQTKYEDIASV